MSATEQFANVLSAAKNGDIAAEGQLWNLVYKELRNLARRRLRNSRPGDTVSTTVLVHEVYLKIGGEKGLAVNDRSHFMALACRAMRQFLVQNARYRNAKKREGDQFPVTFDENIRGLGSEKVDLIQLNSALETLEALDKRMVQVVECRYFGGLSSQETAQALEVSARTVERDWTKAKMYLFQALTES